MSYLKLIFILMVISLISIYGFVQSGLFNVAATKKDGPLLTWLFHTTMERSVENRASEIDVPDLDDREMILAGTSDYVGMCAQCHGEPGKQPGVLAQGLNPTPPDLKTLAEDGTAAEKFWIITNGIRMTGMPAFGKTHKPDEIWPVVAFLQSAGKFDTAGYNKLIAESKSYGHHANDEEDDQGHDDVAHDHSAPSTSDSSSMEQIHTHGDEDHGPVSTSTLTNDEMSIHDIEEKIPGSQHVHSAEANEHSH